MYCNICGKKISNDKTLCDECQKKHQEILKKNIPANNESLVSKGMNTSEKESSLSMNPSLNVQPIEPAKEEEKISKKKKNALFIIFESSICFIISILAIYLYCKIAIKNGLDDSYKWIWLIYVGMFAPFCFLCIFIDSLKNEKKVLAIISLALTILLGSLGIDLLFMCVYQSLLHLLSLIPFVLELIIIKVTNK